MHAYDYVQILQYEYMCNFDNTILARLRTNKVPSVSNKLAEYDDTKASCPTESTQVSVVEAPDSAITDEINKRQRFPAAYAVVNSKDVRKNINHQCTIA